MGFTSLIVVTGIVTAIMALVGFTRQSVMTVDESTPGIPIDQAALATATE